MNRASPSHRVRVGSVRPSHLMFTSGVGALVDLPNFSVLVNGLDDWQRYYDAMPGGHGVIEMPRLRKTVGHILRCDIEELRPAPWRDGLETDFNNAASRIGVPVQVFPRWLRCTACHTLASLESRQFGFVNEVARRPDEARFYHRGCRSKPNGKPLAVPARFVLACGVGHLDDFPYLLFVHRGGSCTERYPLLRMNDHGDNRGANITITCQSCDIDPRNMREAMGIRGEQTLPKCRGRHPHLSVFDTCTEPLRVLVIGASNQWFPDVRSAFAVPDGATDELGTVIENLWDRLREVPQAVFEYNVKAEPAYRKLTKWSVEKVWAAIEAKRTRERGESDPETKPDLRTPEWNAFTATPTPDASPDFTIRRSLTGVPTALDGFLDDVVQAERLREVRALIGFTRLDAPDPDQPRPWARARLTRDRPRWLPATEVRGEGMFLRISAERLSTWEEYAKHSAALRSLHNAYHHYRRNRYSNRVSDFDPDIGWPKVRYIALHSLSHLLLRTIALECGYSAASLSERIYAADDQAGILIYTAVPDAEGTLGGLVSLAEPDVLSSLFRRALSDARQCSSDPLCAESQPHKDDDSLHGAACHVCLFASETTCETGNRFLDRRFVVPLDDEKLALFPDLP